MPLCTSDHACLLRAGFVSFHLMAILQRCRWKVLGVQEKVTKGQHYHSASFPVTLRCQWESCRLERGFLGRQKGPENTSGEDGLGMCVFLLEVPRNSRTQPLGPQHTQVCAKRPSAGVC